MIHTGTELPGTYAANGLLARRLCEKGVRFVQLFHCGWDHHTNLVSSIKLTDIGGRVVREILGWHNSARSPVT